MYAWCLLLSALATGIAGTGGAHGATSTEITSSGILTSGVTSFLSSQSSASGKPKAYVNWILFDEQFNYVSSTSGFEQVGADDTYTTHTQSNMPVSKNGFLYIYVSNETPNIPVFFDNLQVTHVRGQMLEESAYYPFGLKMDGISSSAAGGKQNKEKTFQGQRFDDELGLNWVQFKWRNYDPQIGRFIEIDPLSEDYDYNSTYAFSENKVTNNIELEGLESSPVEQTVKQPVKEGAITIPASVITASAILEELGLTVSRTGAGIFVGAIFVGTAYALTHPPPAGYSSDSEYPPLVPDDYILRVAPEAKKLNVTGEGAAEILKEKSASDQKLIDEAKQQKAKEDASKARTQQRQQQTKEGKTKQGQSNQGTRGSHNSGNQNSTKKQKHDKAEARRAKEQAAADKKKEEAKKD